MSAVPSESEEISTHNSADEQKQTDSSLLLHKYFDLDIDGRPRLFSYVRLPVRLNLLIRSLVLAHVNNCFPTFDTTADASLICFIAQFPENSG